MPVFINNAGTSQAVKYKSDAVSAYNKQISDEEEKRKRQQQLQDQVQKEQTQSQKERTGFGSQTTLGNLGSAFQDMRKGLGDAAGFLVPQGAGEIVPPEAQTKIYSPSPQDRAEAQKIIQDATNEDIQNYSLKNERHLEKLVVGSAVSGATGNIIPQTEQPQDTKEKIVSGLAQVAGTVSSFKVIEGALALGTSKIPQLVSIAAKYPKVSAYAKAIGAFDIYGQLNPDLGTNLGDRAKQVASDTVMAIVYQTAGLIPKKRYSVPTAALVTYGAAKAQGANNEDALIQAGLVGWLSSMGGSKQVKDLQGEHGKAIVQDIINADAKPVDNPVIKGKNGLQMQDVKPQVIPFDPNALKPKAGSVEALIEQKGGWKPGMREQFDRALLNKDSATVKKLLPDVPQEYQTRFADNIKNIIGTKSETTTKKTATVPAKNDTPLHQEALKYATPEEFVKAKANLQHRSATPDITDFKPSESGIFFSDGSYTKRIGGKDTGITNAYVDLKNPFTTTKQNVIDLYKEYRPGATKAELSDKYQQFIDANTFTRKEITTFAKDKGFDGLIIPKDSNMSLDGKYIKATVAFSPEQIKTKSQLTDIWKQANAKPVETSNPIETKAIKAQQAKEQSRVFERLQAEHPQALEGDLQYSQINLKNDAKKAVALVAKDPQKAYDIATGAETSKNVTSTAVSIALSEKALSDGNHALYEKLTRNRSLAQTRRGQEIVAEKGSVTDNSTARYVKDLISAKLDALGSKYLDNIKVGKKTTPKERALKAIDAEVAKTEEYVKSKKLTTKDAISLLDMLTCL